MEFREHRLNKAMFYVELMIEEKSLGITLEQLLTVAEDDSRVLRRETELIRALKRFNHIRKMELFRGSFTKDMEKLFETLVKFKKYPQAIDIGKELAHRYETEKNIPPGKWESMLKQLILITDDSEQKKLYKNKLYALYLKENNWKALQTTLVEHMSLLVEDKNKRELVNAGINELMFVFKLQFQQLKEEILKEVNEGLEGKVS